MIEANFEGQQMSLQYDGVISDSIRFLKIRFNFDEYWDGFEKTAVFSHNNEKFLVALFEGNSLYLGDNTCYVPQEVIKTQNFFVSVFGNKNDTVITSSNEAVSVVESGVGNRIPRDPTPTAWAQMLEIEANTNSIANELLERADSGEFDGVGIPEGGSTGQALVKSSNDNFDTEWADIPDSYTKEQTDNKYVPKTTTVNGKALSGNISLSHLDVGAYSKPLSGIPKSDLANGVKASLDRADSALQEHQDISGKADTSYVNNELSKKQSKTDNSLNTVSKTVVGAINELQSGKANASYVSTELSKKQNKFADIESVSENLKLLSPASQIGINCLEGIYFYNGIPTIGNTPINESDAVNKYYVDNFHDNTKLNTSRVKAAQSTTSGDVYDVTYINSLIGNIESLLSNLRGNAQ